MKLSAFISAAILIAAVPAPSVTQYHGALNHHALGHALLMASRNFVNHGGPPYGENNYGYRFDQYGSGGENFPANRYNDIDGYEIDASGIGETKDWNRARLGPAHGSRGNYFVMPNYAIDRYPDSMDMPAISQSRRSLRWKRSLRDGEARYDWADGPKRRPKPRRRKNWRQLYDEKGGRVAGAGTELVKLGGCPKRGGPINLRLKVGPNK